jgi:hypothetical protein
MPLGDGDHCIAAEREADGADSLHIDPCHQGRVGKHAVDYRDQIRAPAPTTA